MDGDGGWTASLEPLAFILRVYGPGQSYGQKSPYELACTAVDLGEDEDGIRSVELRGLTVAPTVRQARAIQRCLEASGYNRLKVERNVAGRRWVRWHERGRKERPMTENGAEIER